MKRLIGLSLAILMILPLLSGCHGSSGRSAFQVPGEFDETKTYEITFWSKNDNNQTQRDIYKKAIADFQAIYPNIKVTLKPYTDYGSIYNDVITNIATNTTPNVCITYPDHIATYMQGDNVVVNLDSMLSDPDYGLGGSKIKFDAPSKDEIVDKFLSECYLDGSCYALPFMRSTEACYINRQMVEKLGYEIPDVLTWDYIWEASDRAMEKDSEGNYLVNGQKVLIPFIYKSTDNMMISMLRQKDAGYSKSNGEILIFNDTTREILLEISKHAVKKEGDRNGAFSTFKISSYPGNFLNAGQCIFAIDSTAGATWMGSGAPNLDIHKSDVIEFDTVVRPIPQYDTANPRMISQGPSVCIFNKEDPQEVLASWIFVQFLLTNDVQLSYSGTEGYIPVTTKALDSEEFRDYLSKSGQDEDHYQVVIDAKRLLMDNINNTFVTPVFNGSTSLRDAAGQLIEEVTKDMRRTKKYMAQGSVDDEYLTELFSKITALYRLDQIETGSGGGKAELGPLPAASVILLSALAAVWLGIGTYESIQRIK
jgi:multiple sugar transport system substrate-binding protein